MLESVAAILLLGVVIALVLAYAKAGTSGVGTWLHAKYVGTGA